jgi:hypothetical protein
MLGNAPARVARQPAPIDQTDNDDGFYTFVMIVCGLATGAVLVALIEAARPLAHLIAELIR